MNPNVMQDVVLLERSQHSTGVETLAQAFNHDPIMQCFYPVEEQSRLNSLRWLSQLIVSYCSPYNQIYTTGQEIKGCAVWLPPGAFPMKMLRLLQLGFYQFPLKVQWQKIGAFISIFNQMEHYHHQDVAAPHWWYLVMLGIAPKFQGQGVGGTLIQPVLHQADRDGVPCYLETSTARGVNFYQKHGFEVVRSGQFAANAPSFWTMKREPHSL
jgi:ribosomal protein S18 acetylase RimI-like enzyme